jgi:hypothetical protein
MPNVSVGRIVHYSAHSTPDGTGPAVLRAAIITEVNPGTGAVSLTVFNPLGPMALINVPQGDYVGSWRWPAQV